MPKVYLCSFATDDFKNAQEVLNTSAIVIGNVYYVINYNENNINSFIKNNKSFITNFSTIIFFRKTCVKQ